MPAGKAFVTRNQFITSLPKSFPTFSCGFVRKNCTANLRSKILFYIIDVTKAYIKYTNINDKIR